MSLNTQWKPQRSRRGTSNNPKEDTAKSPVPTLKPNSVPSVIVVVIPKTSAGELVGGVRNSIILAIGVSINQKKKKQLKKLIKLKRKRRNRKREERKKLKCLL